MWLALQIIFYFAIGIWLGRAATLALIATRNAHRARRDMIAAPVWTPRPLEDGYVNWPTYYLGEKPERLAKRTALRKERQAQKATEYAQALHDRRRAIAWPYYAIAKQRAATQEANRIMRTVMADQAVEALEQFKQQGNEAKKRAEKEGAA